MTPAGKSTLRARLLAARTAVGAETRAADVEALREHLAALPVDGLTVAAYAPVGDEPGSVAMLDTLRRHGARVLLPIVRTADDGEPLPLGWGEYRPGELVPARFGLLEPAPPALPPTTLAEATLVIVPALAVDRHGVRLGRGAGFYDRSLPLRRPDAQLIALVRDPELVDELPVQPHDVPMTHALTPQRGLIRLAESGRPGD